MSQNYSREGERLCKKEKKTPKPSPGTGGGWRVGAILGPELGTTDGQSGRGQQGSSGLYFRLQVNGSMSIVGHLQCRNTRETLSIHIAHSDIHLTTHIILRQDKCRGSNHLTFLSTGTVQW
jgi:hypothetical protein